jgi:serine/threonine protein kinase
MGVVLLARQESLGRWVALKRVALHAAIGGPRLRDLLAAEARALSRLDHPNVVRVHDLVEVGRDVVVMEYVPGGSLPGVLTVGGVTRGQLIGVVLSIGDALDHAHARRIVHSNVKPGNVLAARSGACMLSDFGIARLLDRGATPALVDLATWDYAAPERVASPGRVGRRGRVQPRRDGPRAAPFTAGQRRRHRGRGATPIGHPAGDRPCH